jgi:hypothetical protein
MFERNSLSFFRSTSRRNEVTVANWCIPPLNNNLQFLDCSDISTAVLQAECHTKQ